MDLKVTDSKEHILYNKEEAEKGKFAFTTDDQDMFEICFVSNKEGNGFSRGNFIISIKDPRGTRTDRSQAVHGSLISIKSTTHQHRNYILYTGIQMQKPTKLKLMSRKVSKLKTTTNR